MGVAGAAYGASKALEEILAEQMFKAKLAQQQAMEQARLQLDQRQLEGIETDREQNRAAQRATVDLNRRKFEAEQKRSEYEDTARSNMSELVTDPTQLAAFSMASGVDVPKSVEGLMKRPERDPIADHEAKARIDARYRQPAAGPRTPQFVRMPDGSIKDINGVAPEGARPIDTVADRQAPEKEAANKRAVEAMKSYGDNLLSAIDELIDEDGNLKPDVAGVVGGFDGARPEWAYAKEGSQAALAKINRIQALLNIDTLRDLKSQSRTGATGYGAMNEREFGTIEAASSTVRNRRQSDQSFGAELKRVRDEVRAGRGQGGKKPDNTPGADDATAAAMALIEKARAGRKPQ